MKLLIAIVPPHSAVIIFCHTKPRGKQLSEIVKQFQTHYPKYTRGICLGYRQDIPYIDLKGVYYGFTTEKDPMMTKGMGFRVYSEVVRM
jgi:hypothetical protein